MILTPAQLAAELAIVASTIEARARLVEVEKARDVAETMRSLVPVDTGRLRDSISAEGNEAGPTVPYASFVEFGTSDTAPQSFVWPAAEKHEKDFIDKIADAGEF